MHVFTVPLKLTHILQCFINIPIYQNALQENTNNRKIKQNSLAQTVYSFR